MDAIKKSWPDVVLSLPKLNATVTDAAATLDTAIKAVQAEIESRASAIGRRCLVPSPTR